MLWFDYVLFHILTPFGHKYIRQQRGQKRFPDKNGGVKSQNIVSGC